MSTRIPKYRLHKGTGQAVVTIAGKDCYLGNYGSQKSHQRYGELISKFAAGQPIQPTPSLSPVRLTVQELVLLYLRHAESYYVKDGEVTAEYDCIHSATNPLVDLYGRTFAAEFGPLALKAVRTKMIELGWSRKYINKSVGRIRRMYRYAVSNELVAVEVLNRLEALAPLLEGRQGTIELPPRSAVPQELIDAVREETNSRTKDMIDLALLTGARPGELVTLTGEMLDRRQDVWVSTLASHKMQHKGKTRVLAFGPKAQLILRKYLKADPSLRLFPITRATFSNNIKAACRRLGVTVFTGHWLRHNAATEVRKAFGLDGAQVLLGHSKANTTEIYAHLDGERVVEIARKFG